MQRVLLIMAMLSLLAVSIAVGVLAAHWPFWSRALAWQDSPDGWPTSLPGATLQLRGATHPLPLVVTADAALESPARESLAQVLMVSDGPGTARAWQHEGALNERIDGHELVQGLLPLLIGVLQAERPGLLDEPIGNHIGEWSADPRGRITARQLMWQMSGLDGAVRTHLNPFSAQAQLASGPDFERAALAVRQHYPAGARFEPAAANAQLVAVLASRLGTDGFAGQLESRLWRQVAGSEAHALLDHRRGEIAAHCCFAAAAEDWLRVAMVLAQDGYNDQPALLPQGFVREIARDHAVNPGQGLIWRVLGSEYEGRVLVLSTPGRVLAAAPGTGRALFWAGRGTFSDALVAALLLNSADSAGAE